MHAVELMNVSSTYAWRGRGDRARLRWSFRWGGGTRNDRRGQGQWPSAALNIVLA